MPPKGVIRAQDVAALTQRRPFKPFRIHMSDGSCLDVRHPELAMLMSDRMVIGVPSATQAGFVDELQYCSIMHITRLEELAEAG